MLKYFGLVTIITTFIEILFVLVEKTTYKDKSTLEVLLGEVIHLRKFEKCVVTIYDSGILHYEMLDNIIFQKPDVLEVKSWVQALSDKKYLALIEAGLKTEIEIAAENTGIEESENDHLIAVAIIAKSLSQRMLANFYLKFKKPILPTRMFTDAESAAFWLMSFR